MPTGNVPITVYDPDLYEYVTVQRVGKGGPDINHRQRIVRKRDEIPDPDPDD